MIRPYLGELNDSYEEYLSVIGDIDPTEVATMPWRPEIQKDKRTEALKKLKPDASAEEIENLLQRARYSEVNARQLQLVQAGFAGTIKNLFGVIQEIELDPKRPFDEVTMGRIAVYRSVPECHHKGARLLTDDGTDRVYYYGGRPRPLMPELPHID